MDFLHVDVPFGRRTLAENMDADDESDAGRLYSRASGDGALQRHFHKLFVCRGCRRFVFGGDDTSRVDPERRRRIAGGGGGGGGAGGPSGTASS